ncbi:probable glutathione S-transferase parC [Humulus lupulus]|uniref:probable glutathione S-transferase parC n=1 Tax=Humulus lupulus TaxID=3486 RepID=UPI002B404B30|nr:probable glutathione S-transferase parC [Humulus lupulus]
MEREEVVVIGFWTSPYAMRVQIALIEKGVPYQYLEEETIFHNKSLLLLQSNPLHKKVPVLIHNGKPVCESLVILQYIDDVWKHGNLLLSEQDSYNRAKARFWVNFFDTKLNYANFIADCGRRMWASKGEDQEAAKEEFIESLRALEGELGGKSYFGGEKFGLLDIALIPFSCRFYTYELFCKFSVEKECPKLMEWVKKCHQRQSVSKILPDPYEVYKFVLHARKCLGLSDREESESIIAYMLCV